MAIFLHTIQDDVGGEIKSAKKRFNIGDLKRKAKDAPPIRSFIDALSGEFGIIAEVKRKSPSAGDMNATNVDEAPSAYDRSQIVKAISVITTTSHFGMSIDRLLSIKESVHKPVLRKDFIFMDYQIYEARAFGADAVLLMVNLCEKPSDLQRLYQLTRELGMDALFEVHDEREIEMVPDGATIYGINSRRFMASGRWWLTQKLQKYKLNRFFPIKPDQTVNLQTFELIHRLPPNAIKVAESGVNPDNILKVRERKFNAALIGTSLLKDSKGIKSALNDFESILCGSQKHTLNSLVPAPA